MNTPSSDRIVKQVLSNGLTVLVYPNTRVPKVSSQLWYRVGSKNEVSNERGLAHFLEHLVFKGTRTLSEMDLTLIAYKLSGYSNAFTSYDYTGYLFDFPKQHWTTSLQLFADCMENCTFKQEYINSELKAVIQELKLYKDDYIASLIEEMTAMIFADHPYHHPIIGYKQDLWSITRESLVSFYEKYYTPANATLVVVGDIEVNQVIEQASHYFKDVHKTSIIGAYDAFHTEDMSTRSITLYRDIEQPISMVAFVIPGLKDSANDFAALASWIIAQGKGSRLYRILVEEEKLISHIEVMLEDMFDYSLFFIGFYPYNQVDNERIIARIQEALSELIIDGFSDEEMQRALKRNEINYLALRENNQEFAYTIGEMFLATGNENCMLDYLESLTADRKNELHAFIKKYIRPICMHTGYILPLSESDSKIWLQLQDDSDIQDEEFLSKKIRTEPLEKGSAVNDITIQKTPPFNFPKANRTELDNGLVLLHYETQQAKKIDIVLDMKAYNAFDPYNLQGLLYFTSKMLAEGTKKYSAQALAMELESRGMYFDAKPGIFMISMLREDFEKGLELLTELVSSALFEDSAIEHVRSQLEVTLKNYWDEPSQFIDQLARDVIYHGHPHKHNKIGTIEGIFSITKENLVDCYGKFITPEGAQLAIVGDTCGYDVLAIVNKTIGIWKGPKVDNLIYPALRPPLATIKTYPVNRDQVALGFAGLSVSRFDPNFDSLLLFDQIFTGGAFGGMTSRLFVLREQSGLFYSIAGSLIEDASAVPGMMFINTLVSRDRLQEAEESIMNVFKKAASDITVDELTQAKSAVCNSLVDNFSTNLHTAMILILVERYELPADYFEQRMASIKDVLCEDIIERVTPILDPNHIVTIRVGRV